MFPRYSSKSSNRFEYVLIEGDYGMKTLNGRVSGYSEDVDNYSSKCQNWVAEIWGLKRLMGKESRVAGGDPTQLMKPKKYLALPLPKFPQPESNIPSLST